MTAANLKGFKIIAKRLGELIKQNPDAQTTMYDILVIQQDLNTIAMDIHFRPEVNS